MNKTYEDILKFNPSCEQEETDKKLFLDCLKSIENCLTRDSLLCHFTSSAFVINKDKTKTLCAFTNIYNTWTFLGGHADGNGDLLEVARKETEEESGLKNFKLYKEGIFSLESMPMLAHFKHGKYVPAHIHLNVTYVFFADEKEKLRINKNENSSLDWLKFDELLKRNTVNFMDPIYKKIINKIDALEKRESLVNK